MGFSEAGPLAALVRSIDAVNSFIGRAAAWLGLGMMLVSVAGTVMARVGKWRGEASSVAALDEGQWYLFSLLFLFCAPWALREGAHVRVDVLYGRLGRRGRAWLNLAGGLLMLLPFALFAVAVTAPTAAESLRRLEVSPDAGGLLRYPLMLAVPVAFGLLALQGVAEVLRAVGTLGADAGEDAA